MKPPTLADLDALPPGVVGEIIEGVLYTMTKATRRHDQHVKLPYYAKVGVSYHWQVDIETRVLIARRLESSDWRVIGTYSQETEARIPPFEAVTLNVASWWPPAASETQR